MAKGHLDIDLPKWQEMTAAVKARYNAANPLLPLTINSSPNSYVGLADHIAEATGHDSLVTARWLRDWFVDIERGQIKRRTARAQWTVLVQYVQTDQARPAGKVATGEWGLRGNYRLFYHRSVDELTTPGQIDNAEVTFADNRMTLYEPETKTTYYQYRLVTDGHLQCVTLQNSEGGDMLYFMFDCGEYHTHDDQIGGMMMVRDRNGRPHSGPVLLCRHADEAIPPLSKLQRFFRDFRHPLPKLPNRDRIMVLLSQHTSSQDNRRNGFNDDWAIVFFSEERQRFEVSILTIAPEGPSYRSLANSYRNGTVELVTADTLLVTLRSDTRCSTLMAATGTHQHTNLIVRLSAAWCSTGPARPSHGYLYMVRQSSLAKPLSVGPVSQEEILAAGLTETQIAGLREDWQSPIPAINKF